MVNEIKLKLHDKVMFTLCIFSEYEKLSDAELVKLYQANEDEKAYETLLVRYWNVVRYGIKLGEDAYDLLTASMFAFMDCIKKYDPNRGTSFKTFAYNECGFGILNEYHAIHKNPEFEALTDSLDSDAFQGNDDDDRTYLDLTADKNASASKIIDEEENAKFIACIWDAINKQGVLTAEEHNAFCRYVEGDELSEIERGYLRRAQAKLQRHPGLRRYLVSAGYGEYYAA